MRRLNRREYKNTLRELLGVEINVAELPPDGGSGAFDTVGSNLFMSANQIEQYQALGREQRLHRPQCPSGHGNLGESTDHRSERSAESWWQT
jgi:hypothetical protein